MFKSLPRSDQKMILEAFLQSLQDEENVMDVDSDFLVVRLPLPLTMIKLTE